MQKPAKAIGMALLMTALFVALPACQRQEGPAEKAGKAVDNAMEKTGEQVEKAGELIQDTAKGDDK